MSSAPRAASIGIDVGTSNTVVAVASADGRVETIRFAHGGDSLSVYASTLCFWQERTGVAQPPRVEGGPWAIEHFLEERTGLRFIQSFKTFAASRAFQSTMIFGQRFRFEDLLVAFLQTLTGHIAESPDLSAARVVVGRPVCFAGASPDDALAMQRYRDAFARLGGGHARYVYEPVGAAFSFARDLESDAVVLVADFGGGTSDFSILRFSRVGGGLRAEPLGHAGVGVAGDTFDSRIVDRVISPRLGKGSSYRSFGKVLPLPAHYHASLARWNELALMKGSADFRELRKLARAALDPSPLDDFIQLVEDDLGFPLYRSVSAAKVALSAQDAVEFRFAERELDIRSTITRADFDTWIDDDLARIMDSVDQALASAGIAPGDVDKVVLTGGTSFVPAVRRLFADRFGGEKLTSADHFESIAQGLALIGMTEDPDQWAAAG
ncbi:MAG: Hsp70 family protein [Proteobacteria bacterium]|nr:Hsp70 family protein [Pseudomonadota bacterium]